MSAAYEQKIYAKNDLIFVQGDPVDGLFILKKGALSVYMHPTNEKPSPAEAVKDAICVGTLNTPGCFIGEGGLFLDHRTASVVATIHNTTLEHIPVDIGGLKKAMLARPQMAMTLCRNLARRLREMNSRMSGFSSIAEAVERSVEQYAIRFCELVNQATQLSEWHPEISEGLTMMRGEALYRQGLTLLEQRRETSIIMAQHASHHRSGRMTVIPGQVICEQNKPGRGLFFVEKGTFSVRLGSVVLGSIGVGEIMGEISVLLKESPQRTATVTAESSGTLLSIPTIDFEQMALKKPAILAAIARMLAGRLDRTNHLVCKQYADSEERFSSLAGSPTSCEGLFSILTDFLAPIPPARELSGQAKAMSQKILVRRDEFIKRHQQGLT